MKELIAIQSELKAPKGQYNSFGKYKYRSCEDILEAVKPLLKAHECALNLCDDIVNVGDRYYVKATARITNASGESATATAFAREDFDKKGMDGAQITGTASSYARKYALNGLFASTIQKMQTRTSGESRIPTGQLRKVQKLHNPLRPRPTLRHLPANELLWNTWMTLSPAISC